MCDSYVTIDEQEIFLCRLQEGSLIWLSISDIPADITNKYLEKKAINNETDEYCNNDKTKVYSCLLRCKTIGILIMATNCGTILGMRELYGSESPTQAAEFYLDVCQHYQGYNE